MLTPAQLSAMPDEEKTRQLELLCLDLYGTPRPNAQLSRDFGVSVMTPYHWFKKHTASWAVLFTLDLRRERLALAAQLSDQSGAILALADRLRAASGGGGDAR